MSASGEGRAAAKGPLVAFYATVAVLLAFGLRPEGRVWGVNHWGYWGGAAPWVLAAALAGVPFAAR